MAESKKFQTWLRIEGARRRGEKSIDEIVKEAMKEKNIRTEARGNDGKWETLID